MVAHRHAIPARENYSPNMLRLLYTAAILIAAPLAAFATMARGLRDPAYRDRLSERFGFTRARFDRPPVWVHAVSVGEVQAAAVLIRALRKRYSEHPLLVTTATPTGAQRVAALFAGQATHAYLPYDTPGSVRRFLNRVRPCIAIVMEREIWPNLFGECRRRGIPIVLASARLSASSTRRHQKLRGLFAPALADVVIAAQTDVDAERYRAIGAEPRLVDVIGNIKFDLEAPEQIVSAGAAFRASHAAHRRVWVAGSTHEGEEDVVVDAQEMIRKTHPQALLILAPRHPNRFADVAARLKARDVRFARRSSNEPIDQRCSVFLADTLGELMMFFAAGDVALVGGSLTPIGGHNLLEPAALAKPIVVGPYNFNAQDVADLLLTEGAAVEVNDVRSLAAAVSQLFSDGDRRTEMGAKGARIVASNRGAATRLMRLLEEKISE